MMEGFSVSSQIYFGEGAIERLKEIDCRKAFIVTDPFMVKSGIINKVTNKLLEANIEFLIFSDIVPDPPMNLIAQGVEKISAYSPDLIIAFGGGSTIDATKAICYINQKINSRDLINLKQRFIAIPTTSGTGSEVTKFSVITDEKKNIKYPLISDELLPDEAILDPEFVLTVPPMITADTGLDVLTHAIEAYVSTKSNDFTDALAEKSIRIVFEYLVEAYKNGNNKTAREKLHNASCMAGIAFNNASLGLNHGLAHAIGAKFHVPHGRANGIILPYVIEYNANLRENDKNYSFSACKYAEIAKMLNLPSNSVKQGVRSLIYAIKKLIKDLNIPSSLADLGVNFNDFSKEVEGIADIAMKDKCTETNPLNPKKDEIIDLLYKIYHGR